MYDYIIVPLSVELVLVIMQLLYREEYDYIVLLLDQLVIRDMI